MYKNKSKAINKIRIEYTYWICWQWRSLKFDSWVKKIPWRWEWLPTPVFTPEEFHGERSMESNSPWGCQESDNIELLSHIHTMIIILNGNGFKSPTKRQRLAEWIENKTPTNALCKRSTWDIRIHTEWKEGDGKRYPM